MFKFQQLKNVDMVIIVCIVILSIIGALNVFSTTFYENKEPSSFFYNQITFYIIGFGVLLVLSVLNYKLFKNKFIIFLAFLVTIALLALVLVYGEDVFGTRRWINIGIFNLQPSEFAKISIVLVSSYLLSKKRFISRKTYDVERTDGRLIQALKNVLTSQKFIRLLLITLSIGSIISLIFMEKSLGNTLLSSFIFFLILSSQLSLNRKVIGYVLVVILALNLSFGAIDLSGLGGEFVKREYLDLNIATLIVSLILILFIIRKLKINIFLSLIVFVVFLPLQFGINYLYNNVLEDYQRQRIDSYIGTDSDENDLSTNWNKRQSIAAIGSAGLMGKGFLNSKLANIGYLPFAYTDFAYAAFAEQYGFVGTAFLLLIYLILLFRILKLSANVEDRFGQLICYGVSFMIFLNAVQHIGMNLGKLPITGVPLPFISYGGSSLLSIFIGIGLVLSITSSESSRKVKVVREY